MFTKRIWLLIGALTILSAGVIGASAYLTRKTILNVEIPKGGIIKELPSAELMEEVNTTEIEKSNIRKTEELTSNELEEIISNSEIDTSDWKTYKNEEYGFEFKYPKVFESVKISPTIYIPTNSTGIFEIGYCLNCSISFDNGMYLKIFYSDDQSKYPNLDNLLKKNKTYYSKETTSVGKYKYRNFEGVKTETIPSPETDRVMIDNLDLYLKTDDGFYTFSWGAIDLEKRGFNYRDYFIPMLSTFKFIK